MLLEMTRVCKTYQSRSGSVEALQEVNLHLEAGAFACILGKSGSGKSTLLNLAAGLLLPSGGEIIFKGQMFSNLSDGQLSRLRNEEIGYVLQGYALLPNLTVRANVELPFSMYPRQGKPETERLLRLVGLEDKAERYPSELSGGELRRVEIARALINRPALLLADEPTGDLDKLTAQSIFALFHTIRNSGTAILMVTHDLEATAGCDHLYTMESGRLFHGDRISPRLAHRSEKDAASDLPAAAARGDLI